MKKMLTAIILGLSFMFCLTGCGNAASSQTAPAEDISTTVTTISGSFTVTVRDVIPDYCLDDKTPSVAVVTEFQNYPFTLYVGPEIGSQLTPGEAYVFTIKPISVNYSKETLKQMNLSSLVWELSAFEVIDARLATENEIGLDSLQLTFSDNTESNENLCK